MKEFGELLTMGVAIVEVWRRNAEAKMKVLGLQYIWLHRDATTFNGVGTSTTSGKLKIPMAIRLQESDMVIPGCVHSHEIPQKAHLLLVSQACQAKMGMTKRVRDGSITLDDSDAQSLKVARQVGTGLCIIRIDHWLYNDYVCNPLLNLVLTARLEILTNQNFPIVSHMRWSIVAVVRFRGMCFRLIRFS